MKMDKLDETVKGSVEVFFDSLESLPELPYILTSGGCEKKIQPWYWSVLRNVLPGNLYALPEVYIGKVYKEKENKKTKIIPDFVLFEKEKHVHEGYRASIEFKFNYITQRSEFPRLLEAFEQQRFPGGDGHYGNNDNLYVIYLLAGLFDSEDSSLSNAIEGRYRKYVSRKSQTPSEKGMEKAVEAMEKIRSESTQKSATLFSKSKVRMAQIGGTKFEMGVAVFLLKQNANK